MHSPTSIVLAFALGSAAWTLLEYLLHRFVFHGASPKGLGAREHRRHHAEVDYFAPWWQKGLAALAVAAVMLPVGLALAGPGPGASFVLGFNATGAPTPIRPPAPTGVGDAATTSPTTSSTRGGARA